MLLDTITGVETFVHIFVGVYVLVLFAYILTQWVQLPSSLRPAQHFLSEACEPYLRFWRRLLPLSIGAIDFSPIVGFLALGALDRIVTIVLEQLH